MTSNVAIGIDWLRIGTSFALVVLILGALFWILRRVKAIQYSGGQQRKLQVLETLSVGPRQKIALLRIGTREILVGVSVSQFTALASWETAAQIPAEHDGNGDASS
jgi:flagellar protein FliO/FliZ